MAEEKFDNDVNYNGQICPYPVVKIIECVEKMEPGQKCRFCVDDPLATKSIPDELEEFKNIQYEIVRKRWFWEIIIQKS